MTLFARLAEEKILEAQQTGVFDNLPGAGKPLKLEDDSCVPAELRVAYKLLKNANCLPPEVELRKEIVKLTDLVRAITDTEEQSRRVREINFRIIQLNLSSRRPLPLEVQQRVLEQLVEPRESRNCETTSERPE